MKESNTLAGNVTIGLLQKDILLDTKRQCKKELNTLADNVAINVMKRELLLNTKRQYMKESNTIAGNAAINLTFVQIGGWGNYHFVREGVTRS